MHETITCNDPASFDLIEHWLRDPWVFQYTQLRSTATSLFGPLKMVHITSNLTVSMKKYELMTEVHFQISRLPSGYNNQTMEVIRILGIHHEPKYVTSSERTENAK